MRNLFLFLTLLAIGIASPWVYAEEEFSYCDRNPTDKACYLTVFIFDKQIPLNHVYMLMGNQSDYHRFQRRDIATNPRALPESIAFGSYDDVETLKAHLFAENYQEIKTAGSCGLTYRHAILDKEFKTPFGEEKKMHSFSVYDSDEFFDVITFNADKWEAYFKKHFLTCNK